MSLFVTMEPEALAVPCPLDLAGIVSVAESRLRVFVGINERELALDPGGLLAAADRAVDVGWGIAIEDVGASRAPLALLPVVGADLITLDLRLLVQRTDDDAAAITLAVLQQVELTGAALLVEGVESEGDLQWARVLGATYGRGSHLGDATAITERLPAPRTVVPMLARADVDAPFASPFDLVADAPSRRASEANLNRLMQAVYRTALTPGAAPVILAGGGRSDQPDESSAEGFPAPATMPLLLVLFGTGLPQEPLPGLRGVRVRRDDPLAADRFLIVLSEAGAFAVLARSDRADPGREVEIVLTQDPDLVHSMARQLIRRIPSSGGPNDALPGPEAPASRPEVTVDGYAPARRPAPSWRAGTRSRSASGDECPRVGSGRRASGSGGSHGGRRPEPHGPRAAGARAHPGQPRHHRRPARGQARRLGPGGAAVRRHPARRGDPDRVRARTVRRLPDRSGAPAAAADAHGGRGVGAGHGGAGRAPRRRRPGAAGGHAP